MKRSILALLFATACGTEGLEVLPVEAPMPATTWWHLIHTPAADDWHDTAGAIVDQQDEVIIAGRAVDGTELGAEPSGEGSLYLAKFAHDGTPRWAHRFGVGGFADIHALTTDIFRNIIVVGEFRDGSLDFGTGPLPISEGTDIFVAAFTPEGEIKWSMSRGGEAHDRAGAVTTGAGGRVFVTGKVDGKMMLLALSEQGEIIFETRSPGTTRLNGAASPASHLALDDRGNIFVGGRGHVTDLGGGPIEPWGFEVAWLASYSIEGGAFRWARTFKTNAGNPVVGSGLDVTGLAIEGDEVVLAGGFPGVVDFGGGEIDGGSKYNPNTGFLARYSTIDGAHRASRSLGNGNQIGSLTQTADGRLVITESKAEGITVSISRGDQIELERPLSELRAQERTRIATSPIAVTRSGAFVFTIAHLYDGIVSFTPLPRLHRSDAMLIHLAP